MQQKVRLKQKGSHCNLIFHICCSQGVVCVRVQSPTTSRRRSKLPLTVSRERAGADSITAKVTRSQAIQNSPILKAVLEVAILSGSKGESYL